MNEDMQEQRGNILTDELIERIYEARFEDNGEREPWYVSGIAGIEREIKYNAHEDLANALQDIIPYIRARGEEGISPEAMIEELCLALRGQNSILRGAWRFR